MYDTERLMSVTLQYCALALAVVAACPAASAAQAAPPGQPAPSNAPNAPYPRINPDRSVTFRIRADDAKSVRLTVLGPYDMAKGQDGFWTVTTKPLDPGFYYYAVVVDGFTTLSSTVASPLRITIRAW